MTIGGFGIESAGGIGPSRLDLPAVTEAPTLGELAANIREAIALHLEGEDLTELGLAKDPQSSRRWNWKQWPDAQAENLHSGTAAPACCPGDAAEHVPGLSTAC